MQCKTKDPDSLQIAEDPEAPFRIGGNSCRHFIDVNRKRFSVPKEFSI